jgi:hypothetical protein
VHPGILILRGILAALLIYAFFFKEDADKKVQSRVETWWLRLAYGQEAALSRATAFLRVLARLTGTVFDRLFGRNLFSLRGFGVSACYSIASFFLGAELLSLNPKVTAPVSFEGLLFFFVFLFLGSIPALRQRSDDETLLVWGVVLIVVILGPLVRFMDFLRQRPQPFISATDFVVFLVLVFLISSGSDFCYIALTRWMLRKASELKHWAGILGIVLLDCLLGLILFLGPAFLGGGVAWKLNQGLLVHDGSHGSVVPKIDPNQLHPVTFIAVGVMLAGPAFNTIDLLACFLFFALMAVMLLHRLLWPILEGPIYIFQRFGLIKRKGWLLVAAAGLLFGKSILSVLIELLGKL